MALLATKLYFPALRPDRVPRPHLVRLLDTGMRGPLTLISAPAGSGKTSLIAEWRAGLGNKLPVAWLSLDAADNDPLRFLTYLAAAIESALPGLVPSTISLLQSPQPPLFDAIANSFLEELSLLSANLFLALDDYHLIANLQIHDLLNQLINYQPHGLHLAILTRADPPLPLGRLRVRNQLTEIRANDLRFNLDEITEFFSLTMDLSISQELVASLYARTEGWIAGLQLAALSLQGRKDVENFVAAFTGSHHYVVDFLVDEVLSLQPEKTRSFLLKTSILERIAGPLADQLTDELDGQSMLEEIQRRNLFVISLDDERHWFRYHHLFGDVLQSRLQQSHAEVIPELHRRAAQWFEQNGYLAEAVSHALVTQDLEFSAQMIEKHAAEMLMLGEMRTLIYWLDAIDPIVKQRASLSITKAWALAFTNRSDVVEELLQKTENLIAEDAGSLIWGDVAALRAYLAGGRGHPREAIEFGCQALNLLPASNWIVQGVVNLTLGGAWWAQGDLDESRAAFERASQIGMKTGSVHLASTALCGLANRCAALGELQHARDYFDQALQVSTGKDGKLLPTAADACTGLGSLSYEWNDLPSAEKYWSEGVRLGRLLGRVSTMAEGQIGQAYLRLAQGDMEQAAYLIKEAEDNLQSSVLHPSLDARLAAAKMKFFLWKKDLESARQYAGQREYVVDQPITYIHSCEYVEYGYFLIASGEIGQASRLAENLIESAAAHGWKDLLIQAHIFHALALFEQANRSGAILSTSQALAFAKPAGYLRVFIDRGEAVEKILNLIKPEDGGLKDYIAKLLAACHDRHGSIQTALIEPLSERELEVLKLVATGKSNRQIADELVLATGTVKKHLNNIFGKLNVQNRTECSARARELKLL